MPTHPADPLFSPADQAWVAPRSGLPTASPSAREWPDPLAAPASGDVLCASTLSLVPWRLADAGSLAALLSDESLWRWLPEPDPGALDPERARALVIAANATPERDIVRALWGDGRAQGQVRLTLSACDQSGELSYWLGQKARGRGLASKMVRAAIARAFANLPHLRRLRARVHSANHASARVLAKAGFVLDSANGDWHWLHLRRRAHAV